MATFSPVLPETLNIRICVATSQFLSNNARAVIRQFVSSNVSQYVYAKCEMVL